MKITFLGSGAAEGIPAIFCNCEVCKTARAEKRMHTRCQVLVNEDLLVDFPPDTYYRALANGVDLSLVQYALITHSHSDHFYPEDFVMRGLWSSYGLRSPLRVYGSGAVARKIARLGAGFPAGKREYQPVAECNGYTVYPQSTEYLTVRPYSKTRAGRYTFFALPSEHIPKEPSYMYAISDGDGKSFLFLCDTAYPSREALDFLQKTGFCADVAAYDATFGLQKPGYGHMNLEDDRRLKQELLHRGIAKRDTLHVLTHISHNVAKNLKDFLSEAEKDFLVARDGLTLEV